MVDLHEASVKFYSYRSALVRPMLSLPRAACTDWEKELARLAGVRPDNHTVYQVEGRYGDPVYVWFTDWEVHIGNQIEVRSW